MANIDIVIELVSRALPLLARLEDLRDSVVVFGSAALVLRGVELDRPVDDLDLFLSDAAFDELTTQGVLHDKAPGVPAIDLGMKIEGCRSFPGVVFSEVRAAASPLPDSSGLLVGSLAHLIAWKRAQGRPKDLRDLATIERQMSAQDHPVSSGRRG